MSEAKVQILGCGSATPTLRHNPAAQLVEMGGDMLLVDCGEGTQVQLRRARVHLNRISAVFISHLHGDHCLGLTGMISSFGLLGRTAPLHIYAEPRLGAMLGQLMDLFCHEPGYDVVFHAINPGVSTVVYESRGLTVETIPLDHGVPCCGFLFREKPSLPHIRPDLMQMYGIPVTEAANIKSGASWTTPSGETIAHERLVTPAAAPRSYAYCSDTRYMPRLHETLRGINTLYHESTYCDDMADKADARGHSTARQAATVARDADVGRLILGHFSSRYTDDGVFLSEASEVFPRCVLANEMAIFDI